MSSNANDMNAFKEELKSRIPLKDVFQVLGIQAGRHQGGKEQKYFCFAHSESKPSLSVFDDNHYYCYSCNKHGDIFSIVMEINHCTFPESIDWLCNQFNINKPLLIQKNDGKNVYLDVMNYLSGVFKSSMRHTFNGKTGYEYWQERGFDKKFCDENCLGFYGKPNKIKLIDILRKTFGNYPYAEWGVVNKYGHFPLQERMIIPIRDRSGKIVSFIGRTVVGSECKYLPLINNKFFEKSSMLFMYHIAKKYDDIILCEGQMDALSLHMAGYPNAIALGGCRVYPEQLKYLSDKNLILALDNDRAGAKGAIDIMSKQLSMTFKAIVFDGELKDFNDMLLAGDMTFNVISDVEFVARYCYEYAKDNERLFSTYIKSKDLCARNRTSGDWTGVNTNEFCKAWDKFSKAIGSELTASQKWEQIVNEKIS